jgi:uncharacterized protein YlbG (UPF0298 family)
VINAKLVRRSDTRRRELLKKWMKDGELIYASKKLKFCRIYWNRFPVLSAISKIFISSDLRQK